MKIVKAQPILVQTSPVQLGRNSQMCMAIGVGFRLSDPRILAHEATVWEAIAKTPTAVPMSETGLPKLFAEWLLAGDSVCLFESEDAQRQRDWTAHVRIDRSEKKINAQADVCRDKKGLCTARLNVDHAQAWTGNAHENPAGKKGLTAPLQGMSSRGAILDAEAGMGPVDIGWQSRKQWMPKMGGTMQAMAADGSHMGWPKATDMRFFQQAVSNQWAKVHEWPCGAGFELIGFGEQGQGFAGTLPQLKPQVLVQRQGVMREVEMVQQTVWFLPNHDLGVMWWSGAAEMAHVLDDGLQMLVVAMLDHDQPIDSAHLKQYAMRRTNLVQPDMSAQSDLPLLPSIERGWTWEQILSAEQHPRDRLEVPTYPQLRMLVQETIQNQNVLHEAYQNIDKVEPVKQVEVKDYFEEKELSMDWRQKIIESKDKRIVNQVISYQDLRGMRFENWYLENVRFEFCHLGESDWLDSHWSQVEFSDCTLSAGHWQKVQWRQGALERGQFFDMVWTEVEVSDVRFQHAHISNHSVKKGAWAQVLMEHVRGQHMHWDELQVNGLTLSQSHFSKEFNWNSSKFINLSVLESQLQGISINLCHFDKFSVIKSNLSESQWRNSRLLYGVISHESEITQSKWLDCECVNACWAGLHAQRVMIDHCNFVRLNAQGIKMSESNWRNCILDEAIFLNADAQASQFHMSSLKGALFCGALLQDSLVEHCNLIRMNLANAVHPEGTRWSDNLNAGMIDQPKKIP